MSSEFLTIRVDIQKLKMLNPTAFEIKPWLTNAEIFLGLCATLLSAMPG
jgi:hypothetical protein